MNICDVKALVGTKCTPCEGGIPPLDSEQVQGYLVELNGWESSNDQKMISKKWKFKNFIEAMDFCQKIGQLAEQEQHHPDLHLTGYRHVRIDITTHAIGGLSLNDFILAAKIEQLK